MFNTSLRRVARTCPNATLPIRPSPVPSHAAITSRFSTRSHQRRHSSSKPPIPPNNGAPPIPSSHVKQVGTPRSTDKRAGAESRLSKRKAQKHEKTEGLKQEDGFCNEWTRTLPSVPSTQHLNPKGEPIVLTHTEGYRLMCTDVYVASFFSTHRPISITGPLPPETQIDDIEKIFKPQPRINKKRTNDVIYTITSAVQNLDNAVQNQQQANEHEPPSPHEQQALSQRADLIKALTQHNSAKTNATTDNQTTHLDGRPQQRDIRVNGQNIQLVMQEIARRFRPFNVPPPPQAVPDFEFHEKEGTASEETNADTRAVAEITRNTEPVEIQKLRPVSSTEITKGESVPVSPDFFTPHYPQSHQSTGRMARQVYVEGHSIALNMVRRGKSWEQARQAMVRSEKLKFWLISVKRQRRLKMKKHKYKKLQRRTRNLKRRQGKI